MLEPEVRNQAARMVDVPESGWTVGSALRANLPAPAAHDQSQSRTSGFVKPAADVSPMASRLLSERQPRSVAILVRRQTSHPPDGGPASPIVMYGAAEMFDCEAAMTLKDKLEIGLKEDAPFRKDNLPAEEVNGPQLPSGPGRSPEIPLARKKVVKPAKSAGQRPRGAGRKGK